MEPALRDGDWSLVRRRARLAVGDAALMVRPRHLTPLIVERLVWRDSDGWWVLGDNPDPRALAASGSSRVPW